MGYMTKNDQISFPGLALGLIRELENDSSPLSIYLDKTDFLDRKIRKSSPYTSKMNRNKSKTRRLKKLLFRCIFRKYSADIFLKAYNLKIPEDMKEQLKPGRFFHETINGMFLPEEDLFPTSKKAVIIRFSKELDCFNCSSKKEYLHPSLKSIELHESQPFNKLKLTPQEELCLNNSRISKITQTVKDNMINRITEIYAFDKSQQHLCKPELLIFAEIIRLKIAKKTSTESINSFIGQNSSHSLSEITSLSFERCEELVSIVSEIKKKRILTHKKLKYDYPLLRENGKSLNRALLKYSKMNQELGDMTFGKSIAERLNKTWHAVERYSVKKTKPIKFHIKEIDGNGKGWKRITVAKVIVELGPQKFEAVSLISDDELGDIFQTYEDAKLAWGRFETNFNSNDLDSSKRASKRLFWDTDRRKKALRKKSSEKRGENYNRIIRLLVQKEFNLPQAIRKIQSGIQLCNKSFNNHQFLGPNTDLNQIASEMLFLYNLTKQYREVDLMKTIDEINQLFSL
tara:strand:+ start:219 stop:1763 length:1545 start_codon:yes stop_codon:yes gene_type:complete